MISGANSLVVLRTLHSATGGASEWRPPLVWCREVPLRRAPVTTGGRLNSPSGAGLDPGTLCDSCACRRVTTPGPAAGRTTSRPARTRRRWTTSAAQGLALLSPPRARCSRSAACRTATSCRAATRCRSCTASPGQPSSTRWSTPRARSAPSRISSESRRGSRMRLKALPAGLWPGACQTAGPKYPGARARHRPRRGVGCQFVSSVSPSLCSTFFSRVSPREPHYIASPRELSCELCAVCPAVRTRCYGR